MRVLYAAAAVMLFVATAQAQDHVQAYGETDKEKTQTEIQAEKDSQRAYQRSLGNIPNKASSDPWGTVRSDAPKPPAAKPTASAKSKSKGVAN